MKKLIFTCALLGVSMTSCGWLLKVVPEKSHSMDYIAKGYCEHPKLTNKSAVDLSISMIINYKDGENYTSKYKGFPALKTDEVLDTSDIQFKLGTRVEYGIGWKDWKQGDIIKYELRCNDTLEPSKIQISYDNYKRQRLYVYESKENKATGLDIIWDSSY